MLDAIVSIATVFFTFWIAAGLLSLVLPTTPAIWVATLVAAGCTILARRALARRPAAGSSPGFGQAVVRGALILGAIGFILGFFGPMVFTPGANQGPMLGIFITGPAGALLGAAGGAIWWIVKDRKAHPAN